MDAEELAALLGTVFRSAARNDRVRDVNLFGIRYAAELEQCGVGCRELIRLAGLPEGYAADLAKGMRLAGLVTLR